MRGRSRSPNHDVITHQRVRDLAVTGAGSIQYTRIRAARAWLHLAFSLPEVGMDEGWLECLGGPPRDNLHTNCTIFIFTTSSAPHHLAPWP